MDRPTLLTFDIFGTVVDWRRGLRDAASSDGATLSDSDFDRVIDAQARAEAGEFQPYAAIVASSLTSVLGLSPDAAARIGAEVGTWPLYSDSARGLHRLISRVPCVAITNSDRAHGEQVERQLGFKLSDWVCAEDARVYKPAADFWRLVAKRLGVGLDPDWWHVSAYGDYDLETARSLGLTCVFVERPHARRGPADLTVRDLNRLALVVESLIDTPE